MRIFSRISLLILLLLQGCSSGSLSARKAEQILTLWEADVGSPGYSRNCPVTSSMAEKFSVAGIHEVPSDNAATADIAFKDFTYGYAEDCTQLKYSGPGRAKFALYNDGRWALTQVEFQNRQWNIADSKYSK